MTKAKRTHTDAVPRAVEDSGKVNAKLTSVEENGERKLNRLP